MWNANGIFPRQSEVACLVTEYDTNAVLLCKTHLERYHYLLLATYTCYRQDHPQWRRCTPSRRPCILVQRCIFHMPLHLQVVPNFSLGTPAVHAELAACRYNFCHRHGGSMPHVELPMPQGVSVSDTNYTCYLNCHQILYHEIQFSSIAFQRIIAIGGNPSSYRNPSINWPLAYH